MRPAILLAFALVLMAQDTTKMVGGGAPPPTAAAKAPLTPSDTNAPVVDPKDEKIAAQAKYIDWCEQELALLRAQVSLLQKYANDAIQPIFDVQNARKDHESKQPPKPK